MDNCNKPESGPEEPGPGVYSPAAYRGARNLIVRKLVSA
jgi:hypothetical protein